MIYFEMTIAAIFYVLTDQCLGPTTLNLHESELMNIVQCVHANDIYINYDHWGEQPQTSHEVEDRREVYQPSSLVLK